MSVFTAKDTAHLIKGNSNEYLESLVGERVLFTESTEELTTTLLGVLGKNPIASYGGVEVQIGDMYWELNPEAYWSIVPAEEDQRIQIDRPGIPKYVDAGEYSSAPIGTVLSSGVSWILKVGINGWTVKQFKEIWADDTFNLKRKVVRWGSGTQPTARRNPRRFLKGNSFQYRSAHKGLQNCLHNK